MPRPFTIGRLAAGIAHEINNPLTGVLTFAHLLRKKENLDEQDKQDLDLIINETTRAGEIVRGLLDFARERPAAKELLDINRVVNQTMRLIRSQKQVEQITIQEHLEEDLAQVNGDENQLQQVLLNLSLNACEAMPHGGLITIHECLRTDASGRELAVIEIKDNGPGIPQSIQNDVLQPFFSTKEEGTGLGLPIAARIAHEHRGELNLKSREGAGTTFIIMLPIKQENNEHNSSGR